MKKINFLFLIVLVTIIACNHMKIKVDLIIFSTKIYSADDSNTVYQSIAIKDGKILALGTNEEIFDHYSAPRVYNAIGKAVYPGFIDGHCHFYGYGLNKLRSADLRGTASFDEILQILKKHNEEYNPDWLLGRGWDQNDWKSKTWPDIKELDALFPDKAVILTRIDGHAVFANSAAIEKSGLKPNSEIEGGEILLDKNGNFTGVFIDAAGEILQDMVPEPEVEEVEEALKIAQNDCLELGLTSVVDAGLDNNIIELIDSLQKSGHIIMNINAMLSPTDENLSKFVENGPYTTDKLTVRSVKLYSDGALGSRGALLSEPYSDAPGKYGILIKKPDYYREICKIAYENNYQVCTHSIGDSSAKIMLEIYGEYLKDTNDRRWRIEHSQIINPADIDLFRKYSIIPSIQATHATSDMYWADERIGDERIKWAYAYKDLLAQNGWLINGTDFPIEKIDPLLTFYASVARQDIEGYPEKGFQMENALSREEALRSMTIWAAKGSFEEDKKGSLEVGKNADLVILSDDIMEIESKKIPQVQVVKTILDGKMVYENPAWEY